MAVKFFSSVTPVPGVSPEKSSEKRGAGPGAGAAVPTPAKAREPSEDRAGAAQSPTVPAATPVTICRRESPPEGSGSGSVATTGSLCAELG